VQFLGSLKKQPGGACFTLKERKDLMSAHHHPDYSSPGIHPGSPEAPMHQPVAYDGGVYHQATGPGPLPYGVYGQIDGYPGVGYAAASYPQAQPYPSTTFLGLNFRDQQFWKGAILGAAVTLLLTSETMQKGIIRGVAKMYGAVQGGIQEIKEKFEDVQAELHRESEKK
jgi:hypothetical protein